MQDSARPVLFPFRLARRRQARARHRYTGEAPRVEHEIHRVREPEHAESLRARKPAQHHAVDKAERLQGEIAAGEHTRRIQHRFLPHAHRITPSRVSICRVSP